MSRLDCIRSWGSLQFKWVIFQICDTDVSTKVILKAKLLTRDFLNQKN